MTSASGWRRVAGAAAILPIVGALMAFSGPASAASYYLVAADPESTSFVVKETMSVSATQASLWLMTIFAKAMPYPGASAPVFGGETHVEIDCKQGLARDVAFEVYDENGATVLSGPTTGDWAAIPANTVLSGIAKPACGQQAWPGQPVAATFSQLRTEYLKEIANGAIK